MSKPKNQHILPVPPKQKVAIIRELVDQNNMLRKENRRLRKHLNRRGKNDKHPERVSE